MNTIRLLFRGIDDRLVIGLICNDSEFQNTCVPNLFFDLLNLTVAHVRNDNFDLAVAIRTNDDFLVAARVDSRS